MKNKNQLLEFADAAMDFISDKNEYGERRFNPKKGSISAVLGILLSFAAFQGLISNDAAQCLTETAAEIESKNAEK
jgi:hypothetical protein